MAATTKQLRHQARKYASEIRFLQGAPGLTRTQRLAILNHVAMSLIKATECVQQATHMIMVEMINEEMNIGMEDGAEKVATIDLDVELENLQSWLNSFDVAADDDDNFDDESEELL